MGTEFMWIESASARKQVRCVRDMRAFSADSTAMEFHELVVIMVCWG